MYGLNTTFIQYRGGSRNSWKKLSGTGMPPNNAPGQHFSLRDTLGFLKYYKKFSFSSKCVKIARVIDIFTLYVIFRLFLIGSPCPGIY